MLQAKRSKSGISIVELLVVVVIVGIIIAFSIVGITRTRSSMKLDNTARNMISYLEKARIDPIRRHATETAQMATLEVVDSSTYKITMDYDGTGNLKTRTFPVESGISITIPNDPDTGLPVLPKAVFDWRGDTPGGESFVLKNNLTNTTSTVFVTDSGDVTLNSSVSIPLPSVTTVATSSGIKADAVITSSTSGCVMTTSTSSMTIKKMKTGTVKITHSSATGTNTVTGSATSSTIVITPSTKSITGNGFADFSIYSGKKTGYFSLTFSSPCGSKTVGLTVTN